MTMQAQLGKRREQQATKKSAVAEETLPAGKAAGSKEEDCLQDAVLAAEVLAGLAGAIKAASGAEGER